MPVIGLTSRTLPMQAARQTRPTETVARSYIEPLEACGALPLLIPNADPARADAYLDRIDGLLLTGGDDPHPHLFGEEPHPAVELVDERRDRFEIELCKTARAREMPVFGICRGVQILNIALGGDIYQDIPAQTESNVRHAQTRLDDGPWHRVEISAKSRLAQVLGTAEFAVNSFHHQACRKLGVGLTVCATSPQDGLIEALEVAGLPFFLGVQWHPELAGAQREPLFEEFVRVAGQYAATRNR